MNEEDEVDVNGMPTLDAMHAMTFGVHYHYENYYEAKKAGDAKQEEYHARKLREETGGLLQAIGRVLGDL